MNIGNLNWAQSMRKGKSGEKKKSYKAELDPKGDDELGMLTTELIEYGRHGDNTSRPTTLPAGELGHSQRNQGRSYSGKEDRHSQGTNNGSGGAWTRQFASYWSNKSSGRTSLWIMRVARGGRMLEYME